MIRKAEIKDIESIDKLLYQVHKVHSDLRPDLFKKGEKKYTDSELKDIINDNNKPIFVCVEEDILKGYAFCIKKETLENNSMKKRKVLYIDDLCVDENYRGCGIGHNLYNYVLDYAKQYNYDSIELNVWEGNTNAIEFYNSLGLKTLKTTLECVISNGDKND